MKTVPEFLEEAAPKMVDALNGDDFKKIDKLEKIINNAIGKVVRSNLHKQKGFAEAITNLIKGLSV